MRSLVLLPLLIALLLLSACRAEESGPIRVSPAAIHADPGAYYGSRVTISGEVDDVYSPGTFTIGGDEFDEEVLVLSTDSVAVTPGRSGDRPLRRKDIVQVSGTVERFAGVDTTDYYGFEPSILADRYGDRPVVVARSVGTRLNHIIVTARGAAVTAPGQGQLLTDFQRAAGDDTRDLVGRAAHFSGVVAAEMAGDGSFWGTVGDDSLFVVLVGGSTDEDVAQNGSMTQRWELYGILREIPPLGELTADWGMTPEVAARLARKDVFLQVIRAETSATPREDVR